MPAVAADDHRRFAVGLVCRSIDFIASQALMMAPSCQPLQNVIWSPAWWKRPCGSARISALSPNAGIGLVGPGEAEMLHVVPADGDAVLDELAEALVQPLALLARDAQSLLDRSRVEVFGGLAVHVGAGEHALRR